MKKMIFAALFCAVAVSAAETNLLKKKWYPCNKIDVTINAQTGVVTCKGAKNSGVSQSVVLNQKAPEAVTISGESKAVQASGRVLGNYCLYMDVQHTDGTRTYGVQVPFKTGTHDWEKVSKTYKPAKAIKAISVYALFRNMKGEASFRNISLTLAK